MSDEAEYVAEHLRSAFATDRRLHLQGLDVSVVGETIVVRGAVWSSDQRDAVGEVAHELVPDAAVVNDVEVVPNAEPGTIEDLS
jgi:hypothetical protein